MGVPRPRGAAYRAPPAPARADRSPPTPLAPRGHGGPARRAQEPVDRRGRASIAPAPVGHRGPRPPPPFGGAPIQEHVNGVVVGEGSLEELVEARAIVRDDDELRVVVGLPLRVTLAATGRARRAARALASGI